MMNSKRGNKSGPSTKCESPTPLIPHIKVGDNAKLPKYFACLQRPENDILPAEDLDAIQLELENLLSTVALRYRVLKSELESIDKAEESRDKRGRYAPKESSPNKKRKFDERNRAGGGKLFSSSHRAQSSKLKNTVSSSPAPSSSHEDSMDAVQHMQSNPRSSQENKLLLPRNDIPNKFWMSVEPYCMPITQEDIKLLDDLIEEYAGTVRMNPIPELGPHYSLRWAMDELKTEDQKNAKKAVENGHATPKKEKALGDSVLGPMTQRLVSALMDENHVNAGGSSETNGTDATRSGDVQSIMKNGIEIEKRLKKELIEQGIIEAEVVKEEDDEILTEIKRVRAELAAIGEYNGNELKKLHSAAVQEMKRLEVKKKLDAKDEEIMEYYKRLQLTRQKHRPLTKQEKEDIQRLCNEQQELSELLDSFSPPGPHFSID